MSKISVVVLWMVIGLIFELMMMVLLTIGLVKLSEGHSDEEFLWFLFVLVGASLGCIVFVMESIVICCWWRRKKRKQSEAQALPIAIPSNSANV
ncbi:hypothetical protein AQUCO_00400004v1 [Aquilegia coerulea]|uniref:Uncharacterized protein n=1 Tax=Aquilegia coerulea TaxID=218851 RepID=A0A2G5ESX5_AQUCA|nr:hypothetical protein AQUCO_00400004v1 [Aquilegia coerulea]PIA58854.1 hypothetical protein AQUCO_00400004v1 [Aquilegia coerulea]